MGERENPSVKKAENGLTQKTLIKICGITREIDAQQAQEFGVDAIGLVFFADSPRFVSIEQAARISSVVNKTVLKVGLFVNAQPALVRDVLEHVPLDILQFHGDETAAYCEQFKRAYWKAFRVKDTESFSRQIKNYESASAILADAWHPEQYGGTGEVFDWEILKNVNVNQHLVLAGGLKPENAAQAIKKVSPWGLDVSSGVEESPGIKSAKLMKQFIEEVRSV